MSSRGEVLPSFLPASGIEFRNFYITSTFGKQLIQFPLLYREVLLFVCWHYFNLIIFCRKLLYYGSLAFKIYY